VKGQGDIVARQSSKLPEIYCDLNARMTESGYSLQRGGSVDDLAKIGLTLESAMGRRFTFYMDDGDDEGKPDDIMWDGIVVYDAQWGYLGEYEGATFITAQISLTMVCRTRLPGHSTKQQGE
jgi:hypothetical protein